MEGMQEGMSATAPAVTHGEEESDSRSISYHLNRKCLDHLAPALATMGFPDTASLGEVEETAVPQLVEKMEGLLVCL